jgi:Flp pilus assembly CpaE family ATPase
MPMGDTASYLNLSPQFTLTDALESLPRLDSTLLESFMSSVNGLSVLPGPTEFRPDAGLPVEAALRILDVASHTFTHVVVDGPQSLDQEKLRQITDVSSMLLVVLTPEVPALWRTTRLLHFLESNASRDKVRLVLNRSHKTNVISEKEIEQVLKFPLEWKLPNDYGASTQAVHMGKPLVAVNHSALAASYGEFAGKLTGYALPDRRRKRFALF